MSKAKKEEPTKDDEDVKPEGEEGEVLEGEDGGAKKGKRKLIIIAAAVLVLLIGGGLFASGILGGGQAKTGEHDEVTAEEKPKVAEAPVYYELPQFLVNLQTPTGRVSFLKMSVTLELRDAAAVATMDANKPRIVDVFNTYLRELNASDLQGSAGIYHLRGELLTRLNSTIEEGVVKDILFGEIIVQ